MIAAGANLGTTVTLAAINGAATGGISVGAAAVRGVGDAINLSIELSNLGKSQPPEDRIKSLRSVLKSKYFEKSMDLFCKVNSRMRDIKTIDDFRAANNGLMSCVFAYDLAFNILSAKKNLESYATASQHMVDFYTTLHNLLGEVDRVTSDSELGEIEGALREYFAPARHGPAACPLRCYVHAQ